MLPTQLYESNEFVLNILMVITSIFTFTLLMYN